jgi:hypothetical protein
MHRTPHSLASDAPVGKGAELVERSRGVAGASQRGKSTESNVWRLWRMHSTPAGNVNSLLLKSNKIQ